MNLTQHLTNSYKRRHSNDEDSFDSINEIFCPKKIRFEDVYSDSEEDIFGLNLSLETIKDDIERFQEGYSMKTEELRFIMENNISVLKLKRQNLLSGGDKGFKNFHCLNPNIQQEPVEEHNVHCNNLVTSMPHYQTSTDNYERTSENFPSPSKSRKQEHTNNSNVKNIPTNELLKIMKSSNGKDLQKIGPNGTVISKEVLSHISWNDINKATRKLLMILFDRETLASRSLSGRPSPAFVGLQRPGKEALDPKIVDDIINIVIKMCDATEQEVRQAITIKCADENKMARKRILKTMKTQTTKN